MKLRAVCQLLVACLALLCIDPPRSIADASRGPTGTVKVGIFPFEPFNYFNKAGKAEGLNPDLLREIIRDEDWRIEFVECNWAQCLERLQRQEIDLMVSVARSPERAEIMDYSYEPVVQLWGQVFVRPEFSSSNINALEGRRVGVMRKDISGSNFIDTARDLAIRCEIVEFSSHFEVFSAVQNGSIDAGVAPQHFGLRHAGSYHLIGTSILFSPFSIYFASKRGTQHELLSHIDAHLSRWKREHDSIYYTLLNQWLGNVEIRHRVPTWLINAVLAAGTLALAAAGLVLVLNRMVRIKTRELSASESNLRDAQRLAGLGQWELDLRTDTLRWSENIYSLFDVNRGTTHLHIEDFFALIHPEDRELVRESYNRSLVQRELYSIEHRLLLTDGRIKWVNELGRTEYDNQGQPIRTLGTVQDITARKRAEEERLQLQTQLIQAQKMEAIGTLAGGIAHDFNNILGAVIGYTELAREACSEGSSIAKDLDKVLEASQRAAALIKQILAYSRQTVVKRMPLEPAPVINEAIRLLRSTLPTTIAIHADIAPDTSRIVADPTQIHQVVMNLCTNAFHAMEQSGGSLEISLSEATCPGGDAQQHPSGVVGRFVILQVHDTGPGIDCNILDKIYDPYFTTKEVGKGTGMGLSIVQAIVQSAGGFIHCESESGQGTTFKISFPVATDQESAPVSTQASRESLQGSERLLLIEDDPSLLEMGQSMLERLGYTVQACTDSRQALSLFEAHPMDFDAVITDQTMPGMTGLELADRMLRIRPALPILLCTGYSSQVNEERLRSSGIQGFLMKPLSRASLAMTLRRMLDREIGA